MAANITKSTLKKEITHKTNAYTLNAIGHKHVDGEINFSLPIQRDEVWDIHRKSHLVHSILYGYPIPSIWIHKVKVGAKEVWYVIDGKQRTTSLLAFIQNKYPLESKFPKLIVRNVYDDKSTDEEIIDISGKFFKELPVFVQDAIKGFRLDVSEVSALSDEEEKELFTRLNGGMALKPFELNRVAYSEKLNNYLNKVAAHPFFHKAKISDTERIRYGNHKIALNCLALLDGQNIDHFEKSIDGFCIDLSSRGVSQEVQDKLAQALDFLDSLPFNTKQEKDIFKKANIPPMVMSLYIPEFATPSEDGEATFNFMEPSVFAAKIARFFLQVPAAYKNSAGSGMGKLANVRTRVEEMKKFLLNDKNNAPIKKEEVTPPASSNPKPATPVAGKGKGKKNTPAPSTPPDAPAEGTEPKTPEEAGQTVMLTEAGNEVENAGEQIAATVTPEPQEENKVVGLLAEHAARTAVLNNKEE